MTEEKTLTPEEVREKTREHARKTLENRVFQDIVGSGEVMSNQALYGHLSVQGAKSAYSRAINSEETLKIRKELYDEKMKKAEELHTYAKPSVSDYDIEEYIRTQVEEEKSVLSIGDLEGIVKNMAGDLGVEIPDALKNYIPLNILVTEDGKKRDEKEFTEDEKIVMKAYRQLSQIYNRAAAFNTSEKNRYADLIEPLKQIAEKYKKPEKEK